MTLSDPQYDSVFEQLARGGAHTVESLWRHQGLTMPPGLAERCGRVMAEFLRSRKGEPQVFFNIGMTRLLELVDAAERELPAGRDDPAFLDVFAKILRDEFNSYDEPDPAASA